MAKLNFPTPDLNDPTTLTYTDAGITWTWNNTLGVWSSDLEGSGGGGIEEAPTDGQQYARQNEDWSVVVAGDNNTTINYNGAAAWGSVANTGAILDSLNIASVAKDTDGSYTVTFATPMPNANYAVTADVVQTSAQPSAINFKNKTATGFEVIIRKVNDESLIDKAFTFAVFATNAQPPRGGTGADAWCSTVADGSSPANFNIASVTRSGTGTYNYVFTTPMPSRNYTVVATPGTGAIARTCAVSNKETDGFTIEVTNLDGNNANEAHYVVVHATNAQLPDTITQDELDAALKSPGVSAWGRVAGDGSGNRLQVGLILPLPQKLARVITR